MTVDFADHLIVGGGTAGCVLAERLSRDGRSNVVMVEAGPDTPPGNTPANILDIYPSSQGDLSYYWPLGQVDTGLPTPAAGGFRPIWRFGQARVMGGGSSVMGLIALRGTPADYNEWRDLGCTGWGWDDVLPRFVRIEADRDFGGPLHGAAGPIPIRRVMPSDWPPFLHAAKEALLSLGYRDIADLNGSEVCGFGATPKSATRRQRVSSAQGYLDRAVRARSNLRVITGTEVVKLLFKDGHAVGVTTADQRTLQGRSIILCCGAIHSPTLLMRSGIGPADHLRALGIAVVADRPCVGANLQNHPMLTIAGHLKPSMRQSRAVREMCSLWLRYSSGFPDCPEADMAGNVLASLAPHAAAATIGAVGASLYKPRSRGTVLLTSAAPDAGPAIRFETLSDPCDRLRMAAGLANCLRLFDRPAARAAVTDIFLLDPAWAMRLGGSGWRSRIESRAAALALDIGWLRRAALSVHRLDAAKLLADEKAIEELAVAITGLGGHVAGTCRMGAADDRGAVVDPQCRVAGVGSLRVIDASIMPTLVAANTNLTVQMIAERAADLLLGETS